MTRGPEPGAVTALQEGIERVSDEASGLLTLQVIQRADMPALVLDALAGSNEAVQLLRLTRDTLANIQAAPRRKPMLCGTCPRALRDGQFSVIIARPACDDPTQGLALAICTKCGPDYATVTAKATIALSRIWPDVRPVEVTHPEGGQA